MWMFLMVQRCFFIFRNLSPRKRRLELGMAKNFQWQGKKKANSPLVQISRWLGHIPHHSITPNHVKTFETYRLRCRLALSFFPSPESTSPPGFPRPSGTISRIDGNSQHPAFRTIRLANARVTRRNVILQRCHLSNKLRWKCIATPKWVKTRRFTSRS